MVKIYFPDLYMTLIGVWAWRRPYQAVFRVSPKMTKTEIKEYLLKIYNIPVLKVMTMNYMGKWKRIIGRGKHFAYKRRDYKKAIVTLAMEKLPPLPKLA